MDKKHLELYTDYLFEHILLCNSDRLRTERLIDGEISHDKTTRFSSEECYTSKDLWWQVKPTVHQICENKGW